MLARDLSALARELGISSDSLYRWRKESEEKGSERFPGKGNTASHIDYSFYQLMLRSTLFRCTVPSSC